jgi:hypothetical protein
LLVVLKKSVRHSFVFPRWRVGDIHDYLCTHQDLGKSLTGKGIDAGVGGGGNSLVSILGQLSNEL